MIELKDLPPPWLAILTAVRELAPEAVLAGGALRDLDNGAPVKDLDIFVQHRLIPGHFGLQPANHLLYLQRLDKLAYRSNVADFSSCLQDSDCVLSETFRVSGMDVNVISLDGPVHGMRVLERIDFGICQIGFVPEGMFWTGAYDSDKQRKTFTITRNDSPDDNARTLRRWDRLSQKYPGWSLVNPYAPAVTA